MYHQCSVHGGAECTCESKKDNTVVVLWEKKVSRGKKTTERLPAKPLKFHDERAVLETAQKAYELGCELVDGKRLRVKTKRFRNESETEETREAPPSKSKVKKLKKGEDVRTNKRLKEVLQGKINTMQTSRENEKENEAVKTTANETGHQNGKEKSRSQSSRQNDKKAHEQNARSTTGKEIIVNAAEKVALLLKQQKDSSTTSERRKFHHDTGKTGKDVSSSRRTRHRIPDHSTDSSDEEESDSDDGDDTYLRKPSTTMADLRAKVEVLKYKNKQLKKENAFYKAALQSAPNLADITSQLSNVASKLGRQVDLFGKRFDKCAIPPSESVPSTPVKTTLAAGSPLVRTTMPTAPRPMMSPPAASCMKPAQAVVSSTLTSPRPVMPVMSPVASCSKPASKPATSRRILVPTLHADTGTAIGSTPAVVNNSVEPGLGSVYVTEESDRMILHSSQAPIFIAKETWSLLKTASTMSKFVGDLAVAAFGIPYMQTHSLSGKKSSKCKSAAPPKPAADKSVLRAITEIAEYHYPGQRVKNSFFSTKFYNTERNERAAGVREVQGQPQTVHVIRVAESMEDMGVDIQVEEEEDITSQQSENN